MRYIFIFFFSLACLGASAQSDRPLFTLDTIIPGQLMTDIVTVYDQLNVRVDYTYDGYFTIFRRDYWKDSINVYYLNEQNDHLQRIVIPFKEDSGAVDNGAPALGAAYKNHFYIHYHEVFYDFIIDLETQMVKQLKAIRQPLYFDHLKCTPEGYLLFYNNAVVSPGLDSGNFNVLVMNSQLDSLYYEDLSNTMSSPYPYFKFITLIDYDPRHSRILYMHPEYKELFQKEKKQDPRKVDEVKIQPWFGYNRQIGDTLLKYGYRGEITSGFVQEMSPITLRYNYITGFTRIDSNRVIVAWNISDTARHYRAGAAIYQLDSNRLKPLGRSIFDLKLRNLTDSVVITRSNFYNTVVIDLAGNAAIGKFKTLDIQMHPVSFDIELIDKGISRSAFVQRYEDLYVEEDLQPKLLIYKNQF